VLPLGVEVGVLAGTLPVGAARLVTRGLRKPHDGVVCVHETPVPGMHAFVSARVNHLGMIFSPRVAQLVDRFLRDGEFEAERPFDAEVRPARYAIDGRRQS
jgi:hypothetical protein